MKAPRYFITAATILSLAFAAFAKPQHIHLSWSENDVAHTITIAWSTPEEEKAVVEYGKTKKYRLRQDAESSYSQACKLNIHGAKLKGLEADTVYHYRCGSKDGGWSDDLTFRTGLAKGDTGSFSFAAYGDSRNNREPRVAVMKGVLGKQPRFSIHSGDLVDSGREQEQWAAWFDDMQPLLSTSPFISAAGNHEASKETPAQQYLDQMFFPGNEKWFSFDYGVCHFTTIFLHSDDQVFEQGSEQYQWLEQDLAAANADSGIIWKFVAYHCPLYSSGSHGSNVASRRALEPLFEKYGVDIVLNGHDHHYERSYMLRDGKLVQKGPRFAGRPAGTVHIVTGGAGAPLYGVGMSWFTAAASSLEHYLIFKVDQGLLECRTYRSDGKEVPGGEFSIEKDLSASSLVIRKSVNAREVTEGDTLTYRLVLENTGEATAQGIILGDDLGAQLEFLDSEPPSRRARSGSTAGVMGEREGAAEISPLAAKTHPGSKNSRRWKLSELAPGESHEVVIRARARKGARGQRVDNRATVRARGISTGRSNIAWTEIMAPTTAKLLDDFEDGDELNLCKENGISGANGLWDTECDEYGVSKVTPMEMKEGALHVSGSLGKSVDSKWVWALLLTNLGEEKKVVDISGSVGITFRARSDESGKMGLSVEGTVGGKRLASTGTSHRREFRTEKEWQEYRFRWDEFVQPGWACPGEMCMGPLTVEKVETFNWSFLDEERPFDLWLDDVKVIYEK